MKGTMMPMTPAKPKNSVPMLAKHERMIRRATNHNLHVMTHHGKVMVGRKGRSD